jgi:uncharacterized protein (TIGR03000 family)
MYSVVLLMAMSGSAEMPACHRGGRHHGGCGGGYSGCSGGGCGGGGCGGGYAYGGGCAGGHCSAGGYGGGGCAGGVCYGVAPTVSGAYALADAPATIVVTLPEDAKLRIDDNPTTSTSGSRVFVSPSLPTGREFHYTLTAEVMRDGKPVTVKEKIVVRAGEETRVELSVPAAGVAAAR